MTFDRRTLKTCVSLATLAGFLWAVAQTTQLQAADGAVSITALDVPINETFDTLVTTGTATWLNDSTLPAWYHARTGNGTTIVAGNGGSSAGALYSFGTGTATERALGSVGSGNAAAGNFHWGIRLVNETSSTITSLEVAYRGEQWRNGGGAATAQTVTFAYRVGTGLGATLTDFTTSGVAVPELNFTSPVPSGTAAAIDGNVNFVPVAHTITGLNLAPGQEILLGWSDIDHPSNDHGLAIDDLVVIAHGISGGLPALSIDNVSVTEGNAGTQTATFTVSLSTTAHSGVTVDIATADGTGAAPATVGDGDYVARTVNGVVIPAGAASYSFAVTVNGDTTLEQDESFTVTVANVAGAAIVDGEGTGTITNDDEPPPASTEVVISQVYGGGGNAGATLTHDFVELFNRGTAPVSLAGWTIQYLAAGGTGTWATHPLAGSISPHSYYLVRLAQGTGGTTPLPTPDSSGSIAMAAGAGKVALRMSATAFTGTCPLGDVADFVGYGTASCFEGAGAAVAAGLTNTTAALRKRNGCFDSDNNSIDFSSGAPAPRNSASPAASCEPTAGAIRAFQGSGLLSPANGLLVTTAGIVTGIKSNGFFLEAPDALWDSNPATSEGIFVFTSALPAVAVGDSVSVRGTVSEFFDLTQIEATLPGDIAIVASGQTLPSAVTLTAAILDPNGTPEQLEGLESMRVAAVSLTSVAPTNNFGETVAVLTGVPRPMREPGISVLAPVPPDPTSGVTDCCIPRFDENPERIMVDSDGLVGAVPFSVTSNVVMSNIVGPLDFTFGDYKVLPSTPPAVGANMSGVPVPPPAADELTVGGFNIENFANDPTRRAKASLAIRQLMRSPDVIGHIEILDLATLQTLADQVNADTVAAGGPDPGYLAVLIPAPLGGTQNVGFLVKTARVRIDAVSQELGSDTFINPNTGLPETLHDRPPLVLRATFDYNGSNPRPFIAIVNHLRSFIDVELVGGEGPRVRAKRTAQAESVAGLLQTLQVGNPGTPVISVGDYNAFQFNDGYTDPISVLLGTPTPDDQVVVDASPDVVNPNYTNLTTLLPETERYSFIFDGTPQALDHVLVNTVAAGLVRRFAIARGNADFPELPASLFAGDGTRPERVSDHDMPVAYFRFPPPSADLALTVSAPPTAEVGQPITFTYTVRNTGPSPAQNVRVTSQLPAGTTVTSCTASDGGSCTPSGTTQTITFPGVVAAGTMRTVTLVATAACTVPNGGSLVSNASVQATTTDEQPSNNAASALVTVTNAAPQIRDAGTSLTSLWPPNHKMVDVQVRYDTTDSCGPAQATLAVTSNEPADSGPNGKTSPDWEIVGGNLVRLRAERDGTGTGRIYTITITATDAAGGTSTASVPVVVPHH